MVIFTGTSSPAGAPGWEGISERGAKTAWTQAVFRSSFVETKGRLVGRTA
jgi:hypothetical protein